VYLVDIYFVFTVIVNSVSGDGDGKRKQRFGFGPNG
jgi:hypothetical protein